MSKGSFPLESIFRLRKQQLTQFEIGLQQAQAELNRWIEREAELVNEIRELTSPKTFDAQLMTPQLLATESYSQACYRQIIHARSQQQIAQQRLAVARQQYQQMRTELEKISTLKEEHKREFRRQVMQYESHQLSEIPLRDLHSRS